MTPTHTDHLHIEHSVYAGVTVVDCKYAECGSTNEEAANLLRAARMDASTESINEHDHAMLHEHANAPSTSHTHLPVVVSAEFQTRGRGRRGKEWHGNAGENLYISVGLPAPSWTAHLADYQLLGCMAVYAALEQILNTDTHNTSSNDTTSQSPSQSPYTVQVKYPNDVLLCAHSSAADARKVCGVLVETEFRGSELGHVVCGMGLNVNQLEFPTNPTLNATSMRLVAGREFDLREVRQLVLQNFFELLNTSADEVFAAWEQKLNLKDKPICTVHSTNEIQATHTTTNTTTHTYTVVCVQRDGMIRVREPQNMEGGGEVAVSPHGEFVLSPHSTSFRVCAADGSCCEQASSLT
jgi:BirA family biotin operon repressor/biotin-[acetyl-CoA-carboxylase] ligase